MAIHGIGQVGLLKKGLPESQSPDLIRGYALRSLSAVITVLDDTGGTDDQLAVELLSALESLIHVIKSDLLMLKISLLLQKPKQFFENVFF